MPTPKREVRSLLPKDFLEWQDARLRKAEKKGDWIKVPRPGQTLKWSDLPTEIQAAAIWSFLVAGPPDLFAGLQLSNCVEGGANSIEECVAIHNRIWMVRHLEATWPEVPITHWDRVVAAFFDMTEQHLRRSRMNYVHERVELAPDLLEEVLKQLPQEAHGFLHQLGWSCDPPDPPFGKWLLDVGFGLPENRGALMGRVVVMLGSMNHSIVQKRLLSVPNGWRIGYSIHRTDDVEEFAMLLKMLNEITFMAEIQIGDLSPKYLIDEVYGIGGQSHPVKDLPSLLSGAQIALQRQLVMLIPTKKSEQPV